MAHHGYDTPDWRAEDYWDNFGKIGATGNFPDGKLNQKDEGEIVIGIAESEGKIILNFGEKPIKWIGLTKEQAKDLGEVLIKKSK